MTNPNSTPQSIKIPLGENCFAVVDSVDYDLAMLVWHPLIACGKVYAAHYHRLNGKTKTSFLHSSILERKLGRPLTDLEECDHEDGDSLNNRRSNLRPASHSENMRNRKKHKNNRSGYKGVYQEKRTGRWVAQIRSHNKKHWLGSFATPEEAHEAYKLAANELHHEFARFE